MRRNDNDDDENVDSKEKVSRIRFGLVVRRWSTMDPMDGCYFYDVIW